MKRKLFCELSPFTYWLSTQKQIFLRGVKNLCCRSSFATEKRTECLPVCVYKHNSLIRRKLGNVDLKLQENKAINLGIAAPRLNGILIKPGEVFSFWRLVSSCSIKKGYREGLTITSGVPTSGVGGGMCQLTNLLHWLVLHSPLTIVEHHHHDGVDLFPDFNRQVPFGVGTSICYNYLDYRVRNDTDAEFQFILYLTDEYLCGELRSNKVQDFSYHISAENEYFYPKDGLYYRHNEIISKKFDKLTGNCLEKRLIMENNAKVMYDIGLIDKEKIKQ